MKTFNLSTALALLTAIASAAPSATQHSTRQVADRFARVELVSEEETPGEGLSKWEIFPTNDEWYNITHPLKIHHIKTIDDVICQFTGTEGVETWLRGSEEGGFVYVNPPQAQKSAACYINNDSD
ncbi:MAG: hypothetical protein Q9198_002004 [Flavoplaca austrocitrina]